MTPHTAYPVCDFSYKRCCINLMTKACSWSARRCLSSSTAALPPRSPLGLPAPGAGSVHAHRICPPTRAGNAGGELTAHRDQSTRWLISPNQLLKHYTDMMVMVVAVPTLDLKIPSTPKWQEKPLWQLGRAAKRCNRAQRMPAPHWGVVWGLLRNQHPGPFVPLDEAGGLGSVFPYHSTSASGSSNW